MSYDDTLLGAKLRLVDGDRQPAPRPGAEDGEAELIDRAKGGEERAWAGLYELHVTALVRHAFHLCGSRALARDAVQEAFVIAVLKIESFDARATFKAWLRGIVRNVVRNMNRKRDARARAMARLSEVQRLLPRFDADAVDWDVEKKARALALYDALDKLPEHLREAFVCIDIEGQSTDAAASELGITPGNLRVRATRARKKLREHLEGR